VVTVNFYASAKALVGVPTLQVESDTFEKILDKLKKDYPNLNKILPSCTFLVDGNLVKNSDLMINSGSNVDILPAFAGG
jgi:molybdopterin converting factor small subunit